ncbi:MAG TPA: hypothetical protein VE753_00385 [Gaiellaceae bacterium]|nr:hypothetical protein [Gaiellaceae bacterium]
MDVDIRPEPEPAEREAILAGLEKLLAEEGLPAAYRSAWRAEAIRENVVERLDEERL